MSKIIGVIRSFELEHERILLSLCIDENKLLCFRFMLYQRNPNNEHHVITSELVRNKNTVMTNFNNIVEGSLNDISAELIIKAAEIKHIIYQCINKYGEDVVISGYLRQTEGILADTMSAHDGRTEHNSGT